MDREHYPPPGTVLRVQRDVLYEDHPLCRERLGRLPLLQYDEAVTRLRDAEISLVMAMLRPRANYALLPKGSVGSAKESFIPDLDLVWCSFPEFRVARLAVCLNDLEAIEVTALPGRRRE